MVEPRTRRWLIGLSLTALIGGPLLVAVYLSLGLVFAPPWPVPASGAIPAVINDALWARANGGPAGEVQPLSPFTVGQMAACIIIAEQEDDRAEQAARQADCRREHMPAIEALNYVAELHLRGANLAEPGFRKGHAKFVTTIWLARTWTRPDLIGTLADRGEFGMGFRGLEAAAQGYFGRAPASLTVAQAAMIAAFIGGQGPDPWCDSEAAAAMRHRILEGMRDNEAIDEQAFMAADTSDLSLAAPPANHQPCHS